MTCLLSWGAQVAAHAAFVEARHIPLPPPASRPASHGKRRSPARAERHREALLHALRDGRRHPFTDLRAALPHMTDAGIYYLVATLKEEGQIDTATLHGPARAYFLNQPRRSS